MKVMRAPVVLAAVALVLAGYILLFERHRPGTEQERANRSRLLPTLVRAEVSRLVLHAQGEAPLVLRRDPSAPDADRAWTLAPGDLVADGAAVDALLTELDLSDVDRAAALSPRDAGLDPPALSIVVEAAGPQQGVRHTVHLGRAAATGGGVYVRRDDDGPVLVVSRRLLDLAARGRAGFRDRRVVAPTVIAQAAALTTPQGTLRLVDGRWINQRQEWVVGARVVELLRRLTELRATSFIAPAVPASAPSGAPRPPPPGAPPPPARHLEVRLAGGRSLSLREQPAACPDTQQVALERRAGGPGTAPHAPGAQDDQWLCVPRGALDSLWTLAADAGQRDVRLLAASVGEITAVEIQDPAHGAHPARSLVMRRDDRASPWRFVAPLVPYDVDADAIRAWLEELTATTITADDRVATRAPAVLDDRAATDAVAPGGRRADAVVRQLTVSSRFVEVIELPLGRGGAPSLVMRRGEERPVTAPALTALTVPEPLRFRSRDVLSFSRYDAERLRISAGGAPVEEAVKEAAESWRLLQPAAAQLDPEALDRLLGAVTNLRAQRFLTSPLDLRAVRTLAVTEARPAGSGARRAQVHQLALAAPRAPGDGGCTAQMNDGAKTTFVLAPQVCADLARSLVQKETGTRAR